MHGKNISAMAFAGNIDFVVIIVFKVTEPIAVTKGILYLYKYIQSISRCIYSISFYISQQRGTTYWFQKIYRFNAVSILKHFPTVKDIVSKFEPLPLNDFSSLKFDNREIKFGVAQKEDWNLKYYFVYPETRRVVAVPYWNVNPDGINVAYCYSRSIDGRGNGKYSLKKDKRMYITSYRFPILLYRILLLESLLEGNTPFFEQGLYIFPNINLNIANQINRILNNSIQIWIIQSKYINELRDTYLKYISSGIPFFNEQYDAERKELLKENGTICQPPIIEIVPKYKEQASLEQFCKNENVSNELAKFVQSGLFYNNNNSEKRILYKHQYNALKESLSQ